MTKLITVTISISPAEIDLHTAVSAGCSTIAVRDGYRAVQLQPVSHHGVASSWGGALEYCGVVCRGGVNWISLAHSPGTTAVQTLGRSGLSRCLSSPAA